MKAMYGLQNTCTILVLTFEYQVLRSEHEADHHSVLSCTVNLTGENLVLNKYFPIKNKGFFQHKAGKVGENRDFHSIKQGFSQHKAGKISVWHQSFTSHIYSVFHF